MADRDFIQNLFAHSGQSREERMPPELDVRFAVPEERTTADLLRFARKFARFVNHYPVEGGAPSDWTQFFAYDDAAIERLMTDTGGETPPHLALFLAFLELYGRPREIMNGITAQHLDFHFREVLRLSERAAVPDRVHLLLELKKGAAPMLVGPEHLFTAGKDAAGVEMIYAPVRETVVNGARVDSLRTIYLDRREHGMVRHAPVANSSDGLGGVLEEGEGWHGFGGRYLPAGAVGFALASPVLRMSEGVRTVTLRLALSGAGLPRLNAGALQHAFDVFITAPKKWLGPIPATSLLGKDGVLELRFVLNAGEPAVADYVAAVHGHAFAVGAPVVQVLLREENSAIGYLDFEGVTVQYVEIAVDVAGVTSLSLQSDAGTLDPTKAFLPFGPQPTAGARFTVGYAEAFSKKLSRLALKLQWKDIPATGNFATHYAGYGLPQVNNGYFTVTAKFRDGAGHEQVETRGLFDTSHALAGHELSFTMEKAAGSDTIHTAVPIDRKIQALAVAGSSRALQEAERYILRLPVFAASKSTLPPAREGEISFFLDTDFLHAVYRTKFIENILAAAKPQGTLARLDEPYTPAVQSISLSYSAYTGRAGIAAATLEEFAAGDVRFYHLAPAGVRREHAYLRRGLEPTAERVVPILPAQRFEGELLIGLADLAPGDSVSLLFQVAEGSADPELQAQPIEWGVLCDNYWKPIDAGELALDTTNGLLTSGLVRLIIPSDATTDNTLLPAGHIWIRAAVRQQVESLSRLVDVAANAVEVEFIDRGNDPVHLERPLPAGSIARLKNGLAAVKKVRQPYASFGGIPAETSAAFHVRTSERQRHKNRCVTAWDYERIILDAFPRVHRVHCIPHAKDDVWRAPGHVLIVVVPDLRNRNGLDPLQPRIDADTIARITRHVETHAGMGVRVKVRNPRYQKIRLDFKVRFRDGYEFNYYRNALEQELIRTLSPWAFDATRAISFGGVVYRSVLLDVVEDLPYVDYVTDFRMYSYAGDSRVRVDRPEARAETPDMVLVSDSGHTIERVPE